MANLSQTSFEGAILSEADLRETRLHGTDFSFANLDCANFSRAKCKDVRFPSASYHRSPFDWARSRPGRHHSTRRMEASQSPVALMHSERSLLLIPLSSVSAAKR